MITVSQKSEQVVDSYSGLSYAISTIFSNAKDVTWSRIAPQLLPKLEDVHQGYFDAEAGPSGDAWEEWHWTPSWAPKNHPTLFVTGRLRNSLSNGGEGNVSSVSEVRGSYAEVEFGTSVEYAGDLNFGGDVSISEDLISRDGKGSLPAGTVINLPPREHVGINEQFIDAMMEELADEIVNQVLQGV